MKLTKLFSTIAGLTALLFMAFTPSSNLKIGDKAPLQDYKMKDVTGKKYSLSDLKAENGLVVIFSCNTCPFVIAWEDQYNYIAEVGTREKINVVLVNSNEAKRNGDDSMSEMVEHAKALGYTMPYVVDKNHQLADAFGANTTPHVFLFDKDMKLAYTGLINDLYDQRDKVVKNHYLADAMVTLSQGREIKVKETNNRGCSIKRL